MISSGARAEDIIFSYLGRSSFIARLPGLARSRGEALIVKIFFAASLGSFPPAITSLRRREIAMRRCRLVSGGIFGLAGISPTSSRH